MQTYGDAMTLLLAFFIMLYTMSQIDATKFEAFVTGLEVPFGNPAGEGILPESTGIVGDAEMPEVPVSEIALLQEADTADERAVEDGGDEGDDGDEDDDPSPISTRDLDQLRTVRDALTDSLGNAGFAEAADHRIDERGLVVSISAEDVLFELGSTDVSDEGRLLVAAVAEALEGFPNDVVVEGHTDDVPIMRADYTNWNLSTDRAVAVLSLLYEEFSIEPGRLGAAGYGEWRPRAENDTAENRTMNRRVDVLVVAQGVS